MSSNAIIQSNLVHSSSASYLSGPSGHSGGEQSASHNHMPSKYLSPTLKPQFAASQKQQLANNFNLGSELLNDQYANYKKHGLLSSENRDNIFRH